MLAGLVWAFERIQVGKGRRVARCCLVFPPDEMAQVSLDVFQSAMRATKCIHFLVESRISLIRDWAIFAV